MFVGHGLLALAVASGVASRLGYGRRRALALGVVAAAFTTLPDVDVVYPLLATLLQPGPVLDAPDTFWELSTTTHRAATHSLVVGLWTATGVALWIGRDGARLDVSEVTTGPTDRRAGRHLGRRATSLTALGALVVTVAAVSNALAAATVAVMVVGALVVATLAARVGIDRRELTATALVGLLIHPFGDLFTGQPPPFLFPADAQLVASRIELHADPTVHLVGAFLVEIAVVWLAVLVVARLVGRRPTAHVRPQALAGAGFALAVFAIPAPTLSTATGFVTGALAVGVVGVPLRRRPRIEDCWDGCCTALAAVTLAACSYGIAYALVS